MLKQDPIRLHPLRMHLLMVLFCGAGLLAQTNVRFAVVGDFGDAPPNTGNVAALIQNWNPDFVITTGDNNYTNPTPAPPNHYPSWDGAVGQYYHQFIAYPAGSGSAWAGSGSATNRFFASLGNHDWDAGIAGWNSYFELPGNERYFDFVRGPVHFFVIDSDAREPDGNTSSSTQGQWLQTRLAASASRWNIVYFHHPSYSSSVQGNTTALQWPFQSWGAHAVLNGHVHNFERIIKNGFPYIVCGTGGRSLTGFSTVEPGSAVRYNGNYGALLVDADADSVVYRFYSIAGGAGGTLIDRYVLRPSVPLPIQLASFTASLMRGNMVRLHWTTLTETNNYGFQVQTSEEAADGYATIPNSFVRGHGTTVEPHAYDFTQVSATAGTWYYRLMQIDVNGRVDYTEAVRVNFTTGVKGESPPEFSLLQNFPNPFNPGTAIQFHLAKTTRVTLVVYSVLGSEVRTILSNTNLGPGPHTVSVDASDLPSGMYLYRLSTPERTETRTMVLVK